MKTLFSFVLTISICSNAYAQKPQNLARVQRLDGVEVYILCEPLRAYEMVTSVNTALKAEAILTGGLINESITDKVLQFIRRARKQVGNFDAVLYSGGKSLITIKFTEEAKPTIRGIGKVKKIENVDVFVLSEPETNYETIISSGISASNLKWKSLITAGVVNNSIEEDLIGMIKDIRGRGANFDGIIYTGGKSAMSFKYK